jgi:hypothetical protein
MRGWQGFKAEWITDSDKKSIKAETKAEYIARREKEIKAEDATSAPMPASVREHASKILGRKK